LMIDLSEEDKEKGLDTVSTQGFSNKKLY
jgi:hypothetical protein